MYLDILNASIVGLSAYGSGIRITFEAAGGSQPVVMLDGAQVNGMINGQPAYMVNQPATPEGALLSGGSGGYAGGGVGGTAPVAPEGGPSSTVAAVMGGETALVYPAGTQSQTRVTGVAAGLTAYSFTIPADSKPGAGRVSIAQESTGDASGVFAFSTEKGPVVGPSVLGTPYEGNMPVLNFQVGQNLPGYGPELKPGVNYLNAQYAGNPGSNQLVQIEAHNRT